MTAPQHGPQTAAGTPEVPPVALSLQDLQEKTSFGYLFSNPRYKSLEATCLRSFLEFTVDILQEHQGFFDLTCKLLDRLGLTHVPEALEQVSGAYPYNIVVANHPCNGFVDGALLYQTIACLGLKPSIVTASNLISVYPDNCGDAYEDWDPLIPIAMPIQGANDRRCQAEVNEINSLALTKVISELSQGRGVGVFASGGYYEAMAGGKVLLEGSFDRLIPVLNATKFLEPRVIGVKHDYQIPQWWIDLFSKDVEEFYATQWWAAMNLGPQAVRCTKLFEIDIPKGSNFEDLLRICDQMRSFYLE